jgi:hypothetical protein
VVDQVDQAGGSPGRGLAVAVVVAIAGGLAIAILGEVVLVSAGLVVVAAAVGWVVALAFRIGAGESIARPARTRLAIGLALVAIAIGQVGLWLYARSEGGVLPIADYLGETFGLLVPLQAITAAGVAWWTAR